MPLVNAHLRTVPRQDRAGFSPRTSPNRGLPRLQRGTSKMGRSARRRTGECAWESRVLSAPLDKRHKMQIQPRPDSGPACISRAGRGTASGRSGRRERRWNRGEATTVRSGLVTRPQELQRAEREQQHKSDQQPWIVGGMRVRTRPERAKSSAMAAAIPLHPDLGVCPSSAVAKVAVE
jgi:hypothetical protein